MQKFTAVDFQQVEIQGGFWKDRQQLNRNVTAKAVYDRFSDTHRFDALACPDRGSIDWKSHFYWDSDVAKWIEGVAYLLEKGEAPELEELCDAAIQSIISHQDPMGYYNSYFLTVEGETRFTNRDRHELYCAGHLFEAACAYYRATGKDAFLQAMCKFADYIYRVFVQEGSAAFVTGGHPEIELALVRLADTTGNEKYLELAKFFVDQRGNNEKDTAVNSWATREYDQSNMPLKNLTKADGHAVRALYIYCAMADIAQRYDDEDYLAACRRLFDNMTQQRMYITGGLGSTSLGEAFTVDYDLPNKTAYTETCAAIAMAFFARRMLCMEADSRYADAIERVLYNGALSGVSLDGKAFFYMNPLEIQPNFTHTNIATNQKVRVPDLQRKEVFACSCCPPNMVRFIASIGDYLYTHTDDTLFVHQYMASRATINGSSVTQSTNYPVDGNITIGVSGGAFQKIALRIPGWCEKFALNVPYTMEKGYAYAQLPKNGEITLQLDMPVVLREANLQVCEDAGLVAVTRGPVVYCMEGVDNGDHLRGKFLQPQQPFAVEMSEQFGVPVLKTMGAAKKGIDSLYGKLDLSMEQTPLTLIPYFAFANRGITEMLVWIKYRV